MQAIRTIYLGPTNFRGSRVKAICEAKSRVYEWDDALNPEENHVYAAEKLAQELGWWDSRVWASGCLKDGSYCHVQTER